MTSPDWRQTQALKQARWMQTECARCPLCGATVCGDGPKKDHKDWHSDLKSTMDTAQSAVTSLRQRVKALEDNATVKSGAVIITGQATVTGG